MEPRALLALLVSDELDLGPGDLSEGVPGHLHIGAFGPGAVELRIGDAPTWIGSLDACLALLCFMRAEHEIMDSVELGDVLGLHTLRATVAYDAPGRVGLDLEIWENGNVESALEASWGTRSEGAKRLEAALAYAAVLADLA